KIKTAGGEELKIEKSFLTASSVLFDAVYVPSGAESVKALKEIHKAVHFIDEAYSHCKPIAADGHGVELWNASSAGKKEASMTDISRDAVEHGILLNQDAQGFVKAIGLHRFWSREKVPS